MKKLLRRLQAHRQQRIDALDTALAELWPRGGAIMGIGLPRGIAIALVLPKKDRWPRLLVLKDDHE